MVEIVETKLHKMTDHELVLHALTIRDPLLTTALEQELLQRFMRSSGITLDDVLNPKTEGK